MALQRRLEVKAETLYTWPDGDLKLTTEGGWARWLLLAMTAFVVYVTYLFGNSIFRAVREGAWRELVEPTFTVVFMWWLGRRFVRMFPRKQAFVRALNVSPEGIQVNLLIHDLYLNRERREDRYYPWSAVQGLNLEGVNSVEGADLGLYSVNILLNEAKDIGGRVIVRYTKAQADDASARAQQCLEAIATCWPGAAPAT